MENFTMVMGFAMMIAFFVFAISWLVPLIFGIVSLRRGSRTLGLILTISGGVWGLSVIALVGFGFLFFSQVMKTTPMDDFDPSQYQGDMGRIVIPYKGNAQIVVSSYNEESNLCIEFENGIAQAPAKQWNLESYRYTASCDNDGEWVMSGHYFSDKKEFDVVSDSDTKLEIGPPLIVKLDINSSILNRVDIKLILTDATGSRCNLYRYDDDEDFGFAAYSQLGEKLWEGKLESG